MRKTKKIALIIAMVVVFLASFSGGCILGFPGQTPGVNVVDEAWSVIFHDYVDKSKLDPTALSQATVKAMLQTLNDPHTEYIDPETYQLAMSSLHGTFQGIGAQVGTKDKQIIIIAPVPGSPAEKAGIQAGDAILEINGKPTSDMSLEQVVLSIRGPKGTTASLLVFHQGEPKPVKIDVVRADINLATVEFSMKGEFAYIQISSFSERTNDELTPVINDLTNKAAKGIILDLRSNPGGILQVVAEVASHFLKEGVVVKVIDNEGKETTSSLVSGETVTDLPMVVLVNNYSASGSEVLSGALQDYGRATIAGTTTFGKGSVNILRQLSDGSGIYITTARWYTPKGRLIEGKGLDPDIVLNLTGDDAIRWAIDYLHTKIGEKKTSLNEAVLVG